MFVFTSIYRKYFFFASILATKLQRNLQANFTSNARKKKRLDTLLHQAKSTPNHLFFGILNLNLTFPHLNYQAAD